MKRYILILSILITGITNAQSPQFAVVRPDGTTYICPSFDSAYNKAADDDIIYMPGVQISGDKTISKRLTLIGTGHYPDSTIVTGKTVFTGKLLLEKKCWLEGFEVQNLISIISPIANDCSFLRIRCNSSLALAGTSGHLIDGSIVSSEITGFQYNVGGCPIATNLLIKNSIVGGLYHISNSNVSNCLINGSNQNVKYLGVNNLLFTNCIFNGLYAISPYPYAQCPIPVYGNSSQNSIWFQSIQLAGVNNYINNETDTIMVNAPFNSFDYSYNYHLKPGSPYLTAGDDGGQIGIYGGNGPYKEGAVPSNPHIYFKQVSNQTTTSGQLPVQFKVRTNN